MQQMLIHMHGDPIEIEPKKWPKQEAFILFRQRNNKFSKELTEWINVGFGCSIREKSKQSLSLGY